MEILAANDQENLVHNFQPGAAGKQGAKVFGSKTPANKAPKTPFRVPLNDENAQFRGGKSVLKTNGKGNQDFLSEGKKGTDLNKNAFVTPAGPRIRAPLGMKTTNAKTKAFQTPAPLAASAQTQKKTSPRLRRPKVKVHQPEPLNDEAKEVEREIEYMPPRGIPLPDDPEEDDAWPVDKKFPMFEGRNFTRGLYQTYFNPIGDDGLSRIEREDMIQDAKDKKALDEALEKGVMESMEEAERTAMENLGLQPKKPATKPAAAKNKAAAPSTLKAKSAAAALSPPAKPSYALPTTSAESKAPSSMIFGKKTKPPGAPINPSATRHASATTASRSTIGYAQGRAASTSIRKPLSNITRNPAPATTTSKKPLASAAKPTTQNHKRMPGHTLASSLSKSTASGRTFSRSSSGATLTPSLCAYDADEELIREMRMRELQEDGNDEDVDAWMNSFGGPQMGAGFDDDLDDFQLALPEDM